MTTRPLRTLREWWTTALNNRLIFTQFASWPGGQCKFFVVHDQPNRMYWMLRNLVTISQDLIGWGRRMGETDYSGRPGNERRW
ncbi:MAG: hypothetical protein O3A47_07695, partial [Chloroflexi bacterium]|nr:hypothetical protein [Chloroflexota bacterium]